MKSGHPLQQRQSISSETYESFSDLTQPANIVQQYLLKILTNGSSDRFIGSGCQLKKLITTRLTSKLRRIIQNAQILTYTKVSTLSPEDVSQPKWTAVPDDCRHAAPGRTDTNLKPAGLHLYP